MRDAANENPEMNYEKQDSKYRPDKQYKLMGAWGYVGYSILYAIPIIGLIFWLVAIFSDKNINRRNFARSYLCWCLLGAIVVVVMLALGVFGVIQSGWLDSVPQIKQKAQEVIGKGRADSSVTRITEEVDEIVEEPEEQATTAPTEKPEEQTTTVPTEEPEKSVIEVVEENVVTPEFKKAMDSYEAFFAEYVDFMRSYDESSSNLRALTKFASFMSQYADTMEKIDAINEEELSDADMAYYMKVTAHIYEMLAEVVD